MSATACQVQQPAFECSDDTHPRPSHVDSKDEETIFLATGLCAADFDSCFNDDFEDCLNQIENAEIQISHKENCEAVDSRNESSNHQSHHEGLEEVPRKRKFPGPAGILPKTVGPNF